MYTKGRKRINIILINLSSEYDKSTSYIPFQRNLENYLQSHSAYSAKLGWRKRT
jgi:hypothetical protein